MFLRVLVPILILQTAGSDAWVVDDQDSCKNNPNFVKEGVRAALRMNQAARDAIAETLADTTKSLMKQLFEPEATDANNMFTIVVPELQQVYDAIARLELENDITAPYFVRLCLSAEILPLSNAPSKKIYCNTERFKKRDDGEWYDEGTQSVVSTGLDAQGNEVEKLDPVDLCKTPSLAMLANPQFSDTVLFAFTLSSGLHYAITICPWFLDFAAQNSLRASHNFKTWGYAKLGKLANLEHRVTDKFFSEVDLISLFDKIMLHEIAHTVKRGNAQEEIVDVGGGIEGYGWNNCRRIAGTPDKYSNADTYALFASACNLVNGGYTINEDGSVEKPQSE